MGDLDSGHFSSQRAGRREVVVETQVDIKSGEQIWYSRAIYIY